MRLRYIRTEIILFFFQPLQIVGIKMSQCVPFASLLLVCYRTISYLIFLFSRFAQYLNFLVQQIQFQIQRFYKKLNKLYLFCCTFFSSILLRFMNALRCRYHFSTVILLYSLFFFVVLGENNVTARGHCTKMRTQTNTTFRTHFA